jgi:hypothetical protein
VTPRPCNWGRSSQYVQVLSGCDLTPGVDSDFEIVEGGLYVYRFLTDDEISPAGFDMRCTKVGGRTRPVVVAISNLPTGQLTYFDSSYDFRLTNTGSGAQAR